MRPQTFDATKLHVMMNSYPSNNESDERQHLLVGQSNAERTDYGVTASVMTLTADMSINCANDSFTFASSIHTNNYSFHYSIQLNRR